MPPPHPPLPAASPPHRCCPSPQLAPGGAAGDWVQDWNRMSRFTCACEDRGVTRVLAIDAFSCERLKGRWSALEQQQKFSQKCTSLPPGESVLVVPYRHRCVAGSKSGQTSLPRQPHWHLRQRVHTWLCVCASSTRPPPCHRCWQVKATPSRAGLARRAPAAQGGVLWSAPAGQTAMSGPPRPCTA